MFDAAIVFPACAGVILDRLSSEGVPISFPRMRGGDPVCPATVIIREGFSPHARG